MCIISNNNIMSRNIDHTTLTRLIAENGYRIFSTNDVRQLLEENTIEIRNVNNFLSHMIKKGLITPIRKGLYSLAPLFLNGHPLHEYEIAMALFSHATICCYSAFHFHELTDQIPNVVYVGTKTEAGFLSKENRYINNIEYRLIWFKDTSFFGQETVWIGDAQITITDKEKTLLDGLSRPKDCGGFMEVFSAYKSAIGNIDINKLIAYSLRMDASNSKKLGWVLSEIGVPEKNLIKLEEVSYKGYIKLDPSGEQRGRHNKKWQIIENI